MGCNCGGKNKVKAPTPLTQAQRQSAQRQQPLPKPKPAKGQQQSFELKTRDGTVEKFGSRLEAEAANVRRGYTGRVIPI